MGWLGMGNLLLHDLVCLSPFAFHVPDLGPFKLLDRYLSYLPPYMDSMLAKLGLPLSRWRTIRLLVFTGVF